MSPTTLDLGHLNLRSINRLVYLLLILSCFLVTNTHQQPSFIEAEIESGYLHEPDFYPDPHDWEEKSFEVLPSLAFFVPIKKYLLELSHRYCARLTQVYPFSSFAIPPPLRSF